MADEQTIEVFHLTRNFFLESVMLIEKIGQYQQSIKLRKI
jgi:hypothetical protein